MFLATSDHEFLNLMEEFFKGAFIGLCELHEVNWFEPTLDALNIILLIPGRPGPGFAIIRPPGGFFISTQEGSGRVLVEAL